MENITNEQYVNLILKYGKQLDNEIINTEFKFLKEEALKEFTDKNMFYQNTYLSFDDFFENYIYSRLVSFWKNSSNEFQEQNLKTVIEFCKEDLDILANIWKNTDKEVQKNNYQVLDYVLSYITEREEFDYYEDSEYIIKLWLNTDKVVQEKSIDTFLRMIDIMKDNNKPDDIHCMWFETADTVQDKTFEKILGMFKDNPDFIKMFWSYTGSEVQKKKVDEFLQLYKGNTNIKIDVISNSFYDFKYTDLANDKIISDIYDFAVMLNKSKFQIPYEYAIELVEQNKYKDFFDDTNFRFFRAELPNINEKLSKYEKAEKISFYKFARCLGCFSKEKIKDENGNDTETVVGQKASSFLANMLKNPNFRLRKFS